MRPIYFDIAVRYCLFNDISDFFNYEFFNWLHFCEYFFDRIAELKNLIMKLFVNVMLILILNVLLHHDQTAMTLTRNLRNYLLISFHHVYQFIIRKLRFLLLMRFLMKINLNLVFGLSKIRSCTVSKK